MRPWVWLTFGQNLGQVDLCFRCSATSRDLVANQVRLNFGQMYPQDEASIQVNIWSAFGQIDLWSDVPPRMRLPFKLIFGQHFG